MPKIETQKINGFDISNYSKILFTIYSSQEYEGIIVYEGNYIYICHNAIISYRGSLPITLPFGYMYSWQVRLQSNNTLNDGFKIVAVNNVLDYNKELNIYTSHNNTGGLSIKDSEKKDLFTISKVQFPACCGSYVVEIKDINTDNILNTKENFDEIILYLLKKVSPNLFSKSNRSYNITLIIPKEITPLIKNKSFILVSSDNENDVLINKETYAN